MRKLRTLTTLACALVLSVACLSGCGGQNNEQMIRNSLSQELDAVVNLDPSMVAAVEDGLNTGIDLSDYGVSAEDFARSYLDGFNYTIDDVKVDGDTAKATVTITCKSLSDFNDKVEAASDQLVQEIISGNAPSDINAAIGSAVMDALNNTELAETEPIVINYTLKNGQWEASSDASSILGQALTNN